VAGLSRTLVGALVICSTIAASQLYSPAARSQGIATVTPPEIAALVANSAGKVVVVNFWATWCPPCLREFPDIIEVYEDYHGRGVEVYAVSMNEAEENEDIEAFIQRFEPPFPVYRAASVDEVFYEGVVESWFGEMPMTLVFDPAGNRVHVHKKPLTYEELAADVTALLPSL
jgi:thiol-disulfide isomerase/thioredoxin